MKNRILTIGYSGHGFGFGRVMQSLFSLLSHDFEIHHIELGTCDNSPWQFLNYKIQSYDRLGIKCLSEVTTNIQPYVIFLLVEPWHAKSYIDVLDDNFKKRIIAYCPVDGELNRYDYLESLSKIGRLVVYNKYGRDAILRGFSKLCQIKQTVLVPSISIISHGVDNNKFFPILDRDLDFEKRFRLRRKVFSHNDIDFDSLSDAFIFLNANRNTFRKDIKTTMEGFKIFSEANPKNVMICLHMGIKDRGINILGEAKKLGIYDKVLITGTRNMQAPNCSDEDLNSIYNVCDVGINTSGGEGWGLISFEHASTGAPQIVPRHSACQELWQGSALFINPSTTIKSSNFHTELSFVSSIDVAHSMGEIYCDSKLRNTLAKAAYKNAAQYQWSIAAKLFTNLINDVGECI